MTAFSTRGVSSDARSRPRVATFHVAGIFETGLADFDDQFAMLEALQPAVVGHFDLIRIFDTDYLEFYTSLGTSLGPVSATLGAAYAPEQDSLGGDDNLYIHLDLESGIPGTPLTLFGHIGYTSGVLAPEALATGTDDTGFDYSIGASFAINQNLSLSAAWVGTDATSIDDFTDDAIVATLSFSF